METAPHQIRRVLLTLLVSVIMLVVLIPGAMAVDLSVDAGFYFKQSRGGTCTLTSAAMMLRRRAYIDGLSDWMDVTENSVRRTAWSNGLSHSFTYHAMQVGYATLPSGTKAKTKLLIQLLNEHPEGIVLYDRSQPHAVLLTDYSNGVFYCSDPAGNISAGRVPISDASISIASSSCYWYIVSDENGIADFTEQTNSSLRLEDVRYPINICTGSSMSLSGVAASSSGTILTDVEIVILNEADQIVQSANASPNTDNWSLRNLDSQIIFGALPEGEYTYMVLLTDSNEQSICFFSDFTVSSAETSTATYWSEQDTAGSKLTQAAEYEMAPATTATTPAETPNTSAGTQTSDAASASSPSSAIDQTSDNIWGWISSMME